MHTSDINKTFEFKKEVGVAQKQVTSLAARLVTNTELYMHVTIYNNAPAYS